MKKKEPIERITREIYRDMLIMIVGLIPEKAIRQSYEWYIGDTRISGSDDFAKRYNEIVSIKEKIKSILEE